AARAKGSQDTDILVALASNYASIGNSKQSLILIRQALAIAPDNPAVQYQVGTTYEILGRRGDAIPLIAEALTHGYGANDFQRDPELAALRADPAFASAMSKEKAKKK